jgi:cysteine desulfuration protein SufE
MSESIKEIQQSIIEEMALFDEWNDKYEYIIELGKKLPKLDEIHKVDANLIKGCQSSVWLIASEKDGIIHFEAESDAVIVKGLVSLLLRVFNNQPASEIMNADFNFIEETGLSRHLAQTRSNGLLSMVKQIKFYAMAYSVKGN